MTAAIVYFLFAVIGNDLPTLTPLASFDSNDACRAAAQAVSQSLDAGQNRAHMLCVSSAALSGLAAAD